MIMIITIIIIIIIIIIMYQHCAGSNPAGSKDVCVL